MKKAFLSIALIAVGAGAWCITARSARFSIQKWDAKFETVLHANLSQMGVSDQDLISSVHEIRKDAKGEWVAHQLELKPLSSEKQKQLMKEFEDAGANVEEKMVDNKPTWIVKRGSRVYQEIHFAS
jgi:hypothetical protein